VYKEKTIPDLESRSRIDERKLDYLFNQNIAPDSHNASRAIQNAQQMQRLGLWNTPEARELVREHLQQVVQTPNNVVKRFTRTFVDKSRTIGEVDTELRESLLAGLSGKFAKLKSYWEVMPDGTRRFLSAEPYGA
jgi:filamentous hemagglutinin